MCNAWNHPPNCACGWGGEVSKSGLGVRIPRKFFGVPRIRHAYESFINPNASCPVCGARVFFYSSPDGGRVFFDELGPPWPKHPCTDNSSRPNPIRRGSRVTMDARKFQWQKEGWSPFFIKTASRIDDSLLKITGEVDGKSYDLYIKLVRRPGQSSAMFPLCLAQAKRANENSFHLSIVAGGGQAESYLAFTRSFEARN